MKLNHLMPAAVIGSFSLQLAKSQRSACRHSRFRAGCLCRACSSAPTLRMLDGIQPDCCAGLLFRAYPANAQPTAIMSAGRRFATLMVRGQMRFRPTQKMRIEPTREMLESACAVMSGWMSRASSVMLPCTMPTGMAAKIQPLPSELVITRMIMKSSTDFAANVV